MGWRSCLIRSGDVENKRIHEGASNVFSERVPGPHRSCGHPTGFHGTPNRIFNFCRVFTGRTVAAKGDGAALTKSSTLCFHTRSEGQPQGPRRQCDVSSWSPLARMAGAYVRQDWPAESGQRAHGLRQSLRQSCLGFHDSFPQFCQHLPSRRHWVYLGRELRGVSIQENPLGRSI